MVSKMVRLSLVRKSNREAPRRPRTPCNLPQYVGKTAAKPPPRRPKMARRQPQDGPKTAPSRPITRPGRPEDPPGAPQDARRGILDLASSPQTLILNDFDIQLCGFWISVTVHAAIAADFLLVGEHVIYLNMHTHIYIHMHT